ncbi:hypothetical protein FB451DRAFT_762489 [Mycena latifolia]|nr:hypothetical protein FB451DRAFT_762489 [Mycena latifolia]
MPWVEAWKEWHYGAAITATEGIYKKTPDLTRAGGSIPVTLGACCCCRWGAGTTGRVVFLYFGGFFFASFWTCFLASGACPPERGSLERPISTAYAGRVWRRLHQLFFRRVRLASISHSLRSAG